VSISWKRYAELHGICDKCVDGFCERCWVEEEITQYEQEDSNDNCSRYEKDSEYDE
jgi:hypothetical protein